jgi:hypothetical protein
MSLRIEFFPPITLGEPPGSASCRLFMRSLVTELG